MPLVAGNRPLVNVMPQSHAEARGPRGERLPIYNEAALAQALRAGLTEQSPPGAFNLQDLGAMPMGPPNLSQAELNRQITDQLYGSAAPYIHSLFGLAAPATPLGTVDSTLNVGQPRSPWIDRIGMGLGLLGLGASGLGMLRGPKLATPGTGGFEQEMGPIQRNVLAQAVEQIGGAQLQKETRAIGAGGQLVTHYAPRMGFMRGEIQGRPAMNSNERYHLLNDAGENLVDSARSAGVGRVEMPSAGHLGSDRIIAEGMIKQGWDPTIEQGRIVAAPATNLDALTEEGLRIIERNPTGYDVISERQFRDKVFRLHIRANADANSAGVAFGDVGESGRQEGFTQFGRLTDDPRRGYEVMRWVLRNTLQEMELSGLTELHLSSDDARTKAYEKFMKSMGAQVEAITDKTMAPTDLSYRRLIGTFTPDQIKKGYEVLRAQQAQQNFRDDLLNMPDFGEGPGAGPPQ